jgi:hypothetical protein
MKQIAGAMIVAHLSHIALKENGVVASSNEFLVKAGNIVIDSLSPPPQSSLVKSKL